VEDSGQTIRALEADPRPAALDGDPIHLVDPIILPDKEELAEESSGAGFFFPRVPQNGATCDGAFEFGVHRLGREDGWLTFAHD